MTLFPLRKFARTMYVLTTSANVCQPTITKPLYFSPIWNNRSSSSSRNYDNRGISTSYRPAKNIVCKYDLDSVEIVGILQIG